MFTPTCVSADSDLRLRHFGSGRPAKVCLRALWLPVSQASVRRLDHQAASLPEVFSPFDGCMTVALLPSASKFAEPESDSSPFDRFAASQFTFLRARCRAVHLFTGLPPLFQHPGFACFRLKAACSACALLTLRVSRCFQRFTPTTVTCQAFSILAPSLGFAPSESVLAVSRTPLGLPCPSFPLLSRLGSKALPLFLLYASGVVPYACLERIPFTCRQHRLLPQVPHFRRLHRCKHFQVGPQEMSFLRCLHRSKNADIATGARIA